MLRHIITTLLKTKDDTDTLEDGLTVSYETKAFSPYSIATVLLGIYPSELNTCGVSVIWEHFLFSFAVNLKLS